MTSERLAALELERWPAPPPSTRPLLLDLRSCIGVLARALDDR